MKKLLFILLLFKSCFVYTQTVVAYDYIETLNWGLGGSGWAVGCGACWYSTNYSVTPSSSALLRGNGNSGSNYESGTYILTNITGLDMNKTYAFRFRVASYKLLSPSASTAGVDVGDYFDVRYSTNNGLSWVTEIRVTGFSNAFWDYNTNAIISKTANGSMTTYTPSGGGDRTLTGDGYSVIELNLPTGITQVRFQIPTRSNSDGEEWWFDNFELLDISGTSLPVELISFDGEYVGKGNIITWSTATEFNSDYFSIERSYSGKYEDFVRIGDIQAAGNSVDMLYYSFLDEETNRNITYYILKQYDFDGKYKTYGPISVYNNTKNKKIVKVVNSLGQEVDNSYNGLVFEVYEDGTIKKMIR
jgi:hypothetical protein